MRVHVFSAKPYDRRFFDSANAGGRHDLEYFETALNERTAALAGGATRCAPSSTTRSTRRLSRRWRAMACERSP